MDIAGAKALKRRLGLNGADDAPPVPMDVPDGTPPVYQWLGVSRPQPEGPVDDGDEPAAATSLFLRLGFSSR